MKNEPKQKCRNCGSGTFVKVGKRGWQLALVNVRLKVPKPVFDPHTGFRVDAYVCEDCGAVQLFAVVRKGSTTVQ